MPRLSLPSPGEPLLGRSVDAALASSAVKSSNRANKKVAKAVSKATKKGASFSQTNNAKWRGIKKSTTKK